MTNHDENKRLTWTRRKNFDGTQHLAEVGEWKYTVDHPYRGEWCLRGWGPYGAFLSRRAPSMAAAKELAEDHAAGKVER